MALTRNSLDDAQWMSLRLVIERIPRAWKRDEAALRRFVEAVLWILRTGAPFRTIWAIGSACITGFAAGACAAGGN